MNTNPLERALELRKTLISDDGKVLVANFSDTLQGADTSKVVELMPNISTGEYVFRAKVNIKEIDPIAAEKYGKFFYNIRNMDDDYIEDLIKKMDFDFPLWFKHNEGFSMSRVQDYNLPFILQVAGCNFHDGSASGGCTYCFVDDKSNDGKPGKGKAFLGTEDTIDSIMAAREKIKGIYAREKGFDMDMKVLRVSGGEPTIALDWILDLWRKVGERGLDLVGQIDSNLSTGLLVENFEKQGIYEKNILNKLAEYPVKVLTAIKGTDEENLQSNVQSDNSMQMQEHSLKKFLRAGFDIYPQMYNPNPKTLEKFLEYMDNVIENFSLRLHIGPLSFYGPTTNRINLQAKERCIMPKLYRHLTKKEWDANYKRGCEIINSYLNKRHGVDYREVVRSDVKLKMVKTFKMNVSNDWL